MDGGRSRRSYPLMARGPIDPAADAEADEVLGKDRSGMMPDASSPASNDNPFAALDPVHGLSPSGEKEEDNPFLSVFGPMAPDTSSTIGAFTGAAVRGVAPTAGGMVGAGAGAAIGAEIGALGGPVAWATVPAGAFVGGLVGFFGGSAATEGVQDWALSQAPDSWKETIGLSERQQRLREQQHPYASFMGGIAPFALTMSPGAFTTKAASLPENATAFQKLMANPVTARVFSGAAMGGMELGQEAWNDQTPDWAKVGIATGFGVVFNKPTQFGEYLHGVGARSYQTIRHPFEVPREGVLDPAEPTVAQAGDLGVVGPGITESTFRGGEEQSLASKTTAQNAAADERSVLGALPEPDIDAIARRIDPEVFQRTDDLVAQRDALRFWIKDQSNPSEDMFADVAARRYAAEEALRNANPNGPAARNFRATLTALGQEEADLAARREAWGTPEYIEPIDVMLARQHLQDTNRELLDLGPRVSSARRHAADHVAPEVTPAIEQPLPNLPPPAPGMIRFFHGGSPEGSALPTGGGGRWTSPDFQYARDYRRSAERPGAVWYVDIPADHPVAKSVQGIPDEDIASGVNTRQYYGNVEVPENIAKGFRPANEAAVEAERSRAAPIAAPTESAPEPGAPKTIDQQRAFIIADRTAQLMAAGQSRVSADVEARLLAAQYVARSAQFNGALGTPEDLYRSWRTARAVSPDGVPIPPTTAEAPKPIPVRSIADIQRQAGVSANRAKAIQARETEPVAAAPTTEPVASTEKPRVRSNIEVGKALGFSADDLQHLTAGGKLTVAKERKIADEQKNDWAALGEYQAQQRAAGIETAAPRRRNRELDRLAADTGVSINEPVLAQGLGRATPVDEKPVAQVAAEIVDRLPHERVVEEINAEAEAGEIEYREAEKAAAEILPEVVENPDAFYDSGQSRSLEELESEHRPADETPPAEQRPLGGGEPEAATAGAGQVPEGGGPPGPVAEPGGRVEPEGATAGGAAIAPEPTSAEPGSEPAAATGAAEPAAIIPASTGAEPPGVEAALIPTPEKPDLPAHTEISGNGGLESLDPTKIGVDAERFQFKSGADEAGISERLQGVETWDPRLAGTALVFRDAEGRNWIADGHQRLGLAQRLTAQGQTNIRLNAFVLDARDGITDAQARVIAAAKNIAEGTGSAIDAAKIVREAETAGIDLPPLPPRSTLVRDGRSLAKLSPDAFGMAVNDVVPIQQAALVGRLVTDPLQQVEAMRVLAKIQPDNARQAEIIVRDVIETATEAATQGGLFGPEHFAASATLERAKVADEAVRQLSRDRTTFHTLVSEAERIQGHGGNVLDVEANQARLTTDEQARQFLTQLATRKGPVSDALTGIARRVRDGEINTAAGAREFLGVVRGRLSEGLAEGPNARGSILGAAREPELAPPDAQDGQARDLLGELIPGPTTPRTPEPTIRTDERQITIPGTEPSAVQAQAARDQTARGALRSEAEQRRPDEGLFAPEDEPGGELFQRETPTWEELLERGRQVRADAQRYAEAGKPAAFKDRYGLTYLVGRDLNYPPDGWRVTIFNKESEPTGHWEAKNAYEAFREVLAKQPELVGANHPEAPDLEQRVSTAIQGRIRIAPGEVRSIITLARTADASTFMHETAHDWLKQLLMDAAHVLAPESLRQDAATIRAWLKRPSDWTGFKKNGAPDTVPQERFARMFEQYLREGHSPSRDLDGVFAKFKDWLTTIYKTLKDLYRSMPRHQEMISQDIREVFDRMLAIEPERTTHGEVADRAPSIANIHEADAVETSPEEAETVSDRIASERARTVATPPPDIAHEIAATTTAQPGTEAPGGATRPAEVAGPGGQSGPVTQGGGVGERPGEVGGGGGEAPAEGPRSPTRGDRSTPRPAEPNGRPGPGSATGVEQLAPRPAESFTGTESKLVDPAGNIRVENLTDVDSIAQAIHDSAERNDDFKSVRGGMTKGQMMDLANAMGLDPDKLDEAALGRLFGGTEDLGVKILAARKLVVQSADIVSGLMKTAAETGLDTDIATMGVAIARHDLIQSVLSGVTAEWGRAGNAFHSLLTGWDKAQDLNQLLKDNLGRDLYQLRVIAHLGARLDTPGKISKMLRDARNRSFGGMLLEYWINGLISGPTTHATYVVGNALLAAMKAGPETFTAAAIGALRSRAGREGERVRFGEVGAQFRAGLLEAPQAAQAAIEALRTGATTQLPGEDARPFLPFQGDTSLTIGRALTNDQVTWKEVRGDAYALIQGMRDGIVAMGEITKAAPAGANAIRAEWSPQGQIPDIGIRGGVIPLGTLARLPSRGVASIHSGFRAMNYSMEINALAYRAASEEGLEGVAHTSRIADLRQNPTEEMMERARGRATDLTLMAQGGKLTQNLSAFFNKTYNLPVLGETALLKFIDPFVHIAGNIMNQALMQRTPIGLFSPEIRADFTGKNGNVAQDTAMAKMLVGTSLALTVGGLAAQGLVSGSGPADPRKAAMWRLAGNQAHSVRIGDIWYDVHRLGPLGMLMSVAADMYDVAHQIGTEDADVVGKSLMHAFTQNILDESFMRGPSDLIKAVTDPDRYGSGYVRNFLVSFMPYSVGMAQMARASDPYSRQARTIMDAVRVHTPGLSESLFPRRDIWGEPMPNRDALGAPGVTAIYAQRMSTDPVNQAMVALGIAPAPVERHIRNIPLTDEQYDDFARIAGRMSKMRLDQFVRSPEWGSLAPADKHTWIEVELKFSREIASAQVATKYGIYRLAAQQLQTKRTAEPVPIH